MDEYMDKIMRGRRWRNGKKKLVGDVALLDLKSNGCFFYNKIKRMKLKKLLRSMVDHIHFDWWINWGTKTKLKY
jgi:hypothetical protein